MEQNDRYLRPTDSAKVDLKVVLQLEYIKTLSLDEA